MNNVLNYAYVAEYMINLRIVSTLKILPLIIMGFPFSGSLPRKICPATLFLALGSDKYDMLE